MGIIEGVDVFAFTDATLALEQFQLNSGNYRYIFTDFRMPSMNGVQLLDKIKEINPNVKRILVSAFEKHDDLFKDCHSIDKFLSKPIILSELIAEVQKYVNKVENTPKGATITPNATKISQPPNPVNGLPQASHRGADGSLDRTRIPRRTVACPKNSKKRAHSSASACASSGRGGVRLYGIPHFPTACHAAAHFDGVGVKDLRDAL